MELADPEGLGTARGANGSYRDKKNEYMNSAENSPQTQYGNSAIEEGGVMTALATGNRSATSHHSGNGYQAVHPADGELHELDHEQIHELDPGDHIHELPVTEGNHDQKNVYDNFESEKT